MWDRVHAPPLFAANQIYSRQSIIAERAGCKALTPTTEAAAISASSVVHEVPPFSHDLAPSDRHWWKRHARRLVHCNQPCAEGRNLIRR
jgi:hypothetical protein